MTGAFTSIAGDLLAAQHPVPAERARCGPTALELTFAAALFARSPDADADASVTAGAATSTTLLVIAPTCSSRTVCRHVAASLGAGNAVHVALFEPPDPLLMVLFAVLAENLPARFVVVGDGRGWRASARETSIVVVTADDAFLNDTPWIRFRSDATEASSKGLIGFYAAALGGGTNDPAPTAAAGSR